MPVNNMHNNNMNVLTELLCVSFLSVVCVGGDGMFSELLHGVIGRTQQEAGLSECDTTVALQPCSLHIGVIPAGMQPCADNGQPVHLLFKMRALKMFYGLIDRCVCP